jgi:hypothetical protein
MNRIAMIIMAGVFGLAITQTSMAQYAFEPVCYNNKDFMKYIDDNHLVSLYSSITTSGKKQEILISNDRKAITAEYDNPKSGSATAADKYCVTNIVRDVTFNDSAIEFLSKLLDKVRGQKT